MKRINKSELEGESKFARFILIGLAYLYIVVYYISKVLYYVIYYALLGAAFWAPPYFILKLFDKTGEWGTIIGEVTVVFAIICVVSVDTFAEDLLTDDDK